MKPPFLKFDFSDLELHDALWLLTSDLESDAYDIEDGRSVGIRSAELSDLYIELRRQALLGIKHERIAASPKGQTRSRRKESGSRHE